MKHWLLILIFLPLLINRRKKQDPPWGNNLSFEYNGQTFSGSANGFPILDNDYKFKGIAIQDFSIFKVVIYFYIVPSGCAYLQHGLPTNACFFFEDQFMIIYLHQILSSIYL